MLTNSESSPSPSQALADYFLHLSDQAQAVPTGWMQGRALFGGLVAAAGLRRIRQQGVDQALRSLNVQFVGPAQPEALRVQAEISRSGKNITHAEARVSNGEAVQTLMQLSFGDDRVSHTYSEFPFDDESPSQATAPDDLTPFPYITGLTPEFTQQIEMRWTPPGLPFSGSPRGELNTWLRLRDPVQGAGIDGELLALMLLDAPPSPVLAQMTAAGPLSSMSWSAFFQADPRQSPLSGWWFYRSRLLQVAAGFAYDQRCLWDSDGRMIAQANQVCAFFPRSPAVTEGNG